MGQGDQSVITVRDGWHGEPVRVSVDDFVEGRALQVAGIKPKTGKPKGPKTAKPKADKPGKASKPAKLAARQAEAAKAASILPKPKASKPAKASASADSATQGGGDSASTTAAARSGVNVVPRAFRVAADKIKLVSDPTRLFVLGLLDGGPLNVGQICEQLGCTQPAVSHHLAIMRHGGIVEPTRTGKHNFYSLTELGTSLMVGLGPIIKRGV